METIQLKKQSYCVQIFVKIEHNSMSLLEFKEYLRESGEDFDNLTSEDRRLWRETFDKYIIAKGNSPPCL